MHLPGFLATPRAAIMATFSAFGAVVGAFSGSVPQMVTAHGLDEAAYGVAVTLMTAATVGSMGIAGTLARLASHRKILLVALPLMLVALASLLQGGGVIQFMILAVLFGLVSGLTDVIMNAEGGAIELTLGRPVYTAFHGAVSLSVAIFAILSSLLSTRYGTTATALAAAVPVLFAMALVMRNIPDAPLPKTSRARIGDLAGAFTPRLVLIGLAAGFVIACEVTALFWSSSLLAAGAPELAAIAGMGAALFGLSNAIIRFAGDGLRARFGDVPLMSVMILVGIAGFAGLSLTEGFVANLVFFAMVGFGVAILCPCLFVMAGLETPANRAAGLSIAMLVAGIPRILMPTIVGAVSDVLSTRFAFGLCAAALVAALIVIRRMARG